MFILAEKFSTDAILCGKIGCKNKDILMLAEFSVQFWYESGKICNNSAHVCFIALTPAGSLGRCLNMRPSGLVFKQLLWDTANVSA